MAKAVYYGISDVARKVKKMYYGVNGVARKVKKGYIGVNGVARLFFSGEGKLSYAGMVASMTGASGQYLAATTVGGYAIFAGGNSGKKSGADAFNASLTHTPLTAMSVGRIQHAGATAGNYALFAGGWAGAKTSGGDYIYDSTADVYDSNLTRVSPISFGFNSGYLGGESAGDYAVFAGGASRSSGSYAQQYLLSASAISSTLTRVNVSPLTGYSYGKREMGTVTFRNYAIFGPGRRPNGINTQLDIYDDSLTKISGYYYASVGYNSGAAVVAGGTHAVFAGGEVYNSDDAGYDATSLAVAIDSNFTATNITALSRPSVYVRGAEAGDFAVLSWGYDNNSYDANLTQQRWPKYTTSVNSNSAATSVGDYALFGGGYRGYSNIYGYLCS